MAQDLYNSGQVRQKMEAPARNRKRSKPSGLPEELIERLAKQVAFLRDKRVTAPFALLGHSVSNDGKSTVLNLNIKKTSKIEQKNPQDCKVTIKNIKEERRRKKLDPIKIVYKDFLSNENNPRTYTKTLEQGE